MSSRPIPFDLATVTFSPEARRQAASGGGERRYLLVFEGDVSRVVSLPSLGEVVIGRSPDAAVRVDDAAASRQHARIVLDENELLLVDLGSRNGTLVNGERVASARPLRRGDVITIGGTSLVVHRDAASMGTRAVLDERQLRRRAEEEIARLARHPQILALLTIRLDADAAERQRMEHLVASELRLVDVVAWGAPDELLVLVPEIEEEPEETARRIVQALERAFAGSNARAGVAQYPMDGGDGDALLSAARAAAAGARPGEIAAAADLCSTRTVGDRTFVVVEPAMTRIYALLERLAKSTLPVLITGETGTGKENAAAAIHFGSARAGGPFVTINCAAIPENLVESELFGYERGAFSGAVGAKAGLLEAASNGTLFLDEVGELSLATQAKLLRVLETQRITRVGGLSERKVDVRLVAATNRDLVEEVRAGRFRQDVLFRLGAATVVLPPLRDRRRELPVLARALLAEACTREGRAPLALAPVAMQRLLAHAWPGNVRELRNVMDFVAATAPGPSVEAWELPSLDGRLSSPAPAGAAPATSSPLPPPPRTGFRPLADEIRDLEKARILEALTAAGGVQTRAAELIGMPVRTLFGKLKLYGVSPRTPAIERSDRAPS